jgi:hypothetical protein
MSKYGAIIEKARKPESQKARKLENSKEDTKEPGREVNLSIKVSESRRRHWAAESKRHGVTLTAAITEALSKRFGEPE